MKQAQKQRAYLFLNSAFPPSQRAKVAKTSIQLQVLPAVNWGFLLGVWMSAEQEPPSRRTLRPGFIHLSLAGHTRILWTDNFCFLFNCLHSTSCLAPAPHPYAKNSKDFLLAHTGDGTPEPPNLTSGPSSDIAVSEKPQLVQLTRSRKVWSLHLPSP